MKSRLTIENVSMPTANTEYSFELPYGTKKFTIKLRKLGYELNICLVSGETENYINLASGKSYTENEIKGQKNTLYFKTTADNMTAEILYWI